MLRDGARIEKLITMVVKLADGDCYDESVLIHDDALKTSKKTCRL